MGGQGTRRNGELAIKPHDFASFRSMPLSSFSGVVFGVDGFASDAGPAHFYSVA